MKSANDGMGEQRRSEAEAKEEEEEEEENVLRMLNARAQRKREDYGMTLPADSDMSARSRR